MKKNARKKSVLNPKVPVASAECYFWVHYGPVLRDMKELRDALKVMSQETFSYHVNSQKNDFAHWVREALSAPALAKTLETKKTKTLYWKTIDAHLKKHHSV